jgi:hypothetical protein
MVFLSFFVMAGLVPAIHVFASAIRAGNFTYCCIIDGADMGTI